MALKLELTDVILGPVISPKAYESNQKQNELIVKVHMSANKPLIAQAIKALFDAEVERVHTFIRKGKVRRVGRLVTRGSDEKRAIIKLKEGYRIDLIDQTVTEASSAENQSKAAEV